MLGDVKLQTAQKRILSSLLIFYAFGRAEIRTVIVIPVVRDPNGQLGIDHIVQAYSSSISDYGFRSVLANPKDLEVLGFTSGRKKMSGRLMKLRYCVP